MSRYRAFTTALGFRTSHDISRSSSDRLSTPDLHHQSVTMPPQPLDGAFTLYLRVHSARNLHAVAQSSYCKLYLGDTSIVGGFGQWKPLVEFDKSPGDSHRAFHTKVQMSALKECPEWNEKFQLSVINPKVEILTIRVKNHGVIYSPAIGVCVVQLRQLRLGQTSDAWHPLYRGTQPCGEIRLQIRLQKNDGLKRRSSQACEATVQRLLREHRELVASQQREVVGQEDERWRKIEADGGIQTGLERPIEREEKWQARCAAKLIQEMEQEKDDNPESDLPIGFTYRGGSELEPDLLPSFKDRNVKKVDHVVTQKMENMSLQPIKEENTEHEVTSENTSGYTVSSLDFDNLVDGNPSPLIAGSGKPRSSVEKLNRVVHNMSDSSESSLSNDRRRKRRHRRRKRENRRRNHQDKQRHHSDEYSDHSAWSAQENYPSMGVEGSTLSSGMSFCSQHKNQNGLSMDSGLPSPIDKFIESSDQDHHHRRRHREVDKTKRREKEKRSRYKRKHGKSRQSYESSNSSSSISSSEEERLLRKLEKRKMKKAQAFSVRAKNEDSHALEQPPLQRA